ncbi:cysteine hydrolase family protein [Chitinophaga ginsengisoli]|uniref:Nicotinamidase-related amidase n=1 Tax=Chitinophaga ginsengisoli TaxID=363837 RepID=A0A2P8FMT6_9BACT|nr:isochorismatase family cysteine hydrolase [Chitinophaga ginsengisoli]PSL23022.1 nicotinamidase-related amidase [Chitinophaga ginsengisoli]
MNGRKIVIIDPQNDFTCLEGLYASRHKEISQIHNAKSSINRILSLQEKKNIIILRSDYREDQFEPGLTICLPDTFGHQIDSDLNVDESFTCITKTEHSGFSSESFINFLKDTGTRVLFLCGFLAEYCVKKTALDALEHGYDVYLIEDCIGTGDDVQFRKQEMIHELESKGATIINSNVYLERIF